MVEEGEGTYNRAICFGITFLSVHEGSSAVNSR
jgi:hypothetical protein